MCLKTEKCGSYEVDKISILPVTGHVYYRAHITLLVIDFFAGPCVEHFACRLTTRDTIHCMFVATQNNIV